MCLGVCVWEDGGEGGFWGEGDFFRTCSHVHILLQLSMDERATEPNDKVLHQVHGSANICMNGKLDHYRPGVGKFQITNMVHAGRRRKRNTG